MPNSVATIEPAALTAELHALREAHELLGVRLAAMEARIAEPDLPGPERLELFGLWSDKPVSDEDLLVSRAAWHRAAAEVIRP